MHNVIIILMLASVFWNYIFKRNVRSNLSCGIFAWTGISPNQFSPLLFNILGVYNDNRGGDSCGVYFNRGSITGIKTDAKYENLVKSQKLHTTVKPGKWPIVIGHCRKASVGTVSENNVQPTLLRNNAKDDKLTYVQAHNGTLTNHKELAKKYNIDVTSDESDSNVLAKLIEKVGVKILNEYEGSAALVFHFTKEPNTLYAFHGQSKSYNVLTEERPLHYVKINGSGIYISSEYSPLEFIANGEKAISFKYNVLYKIKGETVEEFKKIEREKAVLRKSSFNNTTHNQNNLYGKWYNEDGSYKMEEDENNKVITLPCTSTNIIKTGVTKNICCSEIETSFNLNIGNKLKYFKGYYITNKNRVHGEIIVDSWGYLRDPSINPRPTISVYYLYFYYGILLMDKDSFEEVNRKAIANGITSEEEFIKMNKFTSLSDTLKSNAVFPFTRQYSNPGSGYMEATSMFDSVSGHKNTFYTGSFIPLFTDYKMYFERGDFVGIRKIESYYSITEFLRTIPYMRDWGFGDKPTIKTKSDKIKIKNCSDCIDAGLYQDGEMCRSCTFDWTKGDTQEIEYNKAISTYEQSSEDDHKVELTHIIVTQVDPIIKDLDSLIEEVNSSGFEKTVSDELSILVNANEKLKEITK